MKKLLILLSVLIISGTAVPTTIAASSYEKQKNKLENNKINYLQKNNSENLNRIKRDINNNKYMVEYSQPFLKKHRLYYTITPNTFEEIIFWKLNNNLSNFIPI